MSLHQRIFVKVIRSAKKDSWHKRRVMSLFGKGSLIILGWLAEACSLSVDVLKIWTSPHFQVLNPWPSSRKVQGPQIHQNDSQGVKNTFEDSSGWSRSPNTLVIGRGGRQCTIEMGSIQKNLKKILKLEENSTKNF